MFSAAVLEMNCGHIVSYILVGNVLLLLPFFLPLQPVQATGFLMAVNYQVHCALILSGLMFVGQTMRERCKAKPGK